MFSSKLFRPCIIIKISFSSLRNLLAGAFRGFVHGTGCASGAAGGAAWQPFGGRWGGRAPCGFAWQGLGHVRDALKLDAVKSGSWVTAGLWVQAGGVGVACCGSRLGWMSGDLWNGASFGRGRAVVRRLAESTFRCFSMMVVIAVSTD